VGHPLRVPLDVAALRAASRERAATRPAGPRLHAVVDAVVPSTPFVRARHYRPAAEPRPLLVYLHGGMWVLGDLDSHDRLCRRLADEAGIEVVAVDLRRAPEHPWPAAVDDALAAIRWAAGGLAGTRPPGPVGVGGDSSGGCVAALAALALREDPTVTLAAQVLICPNTDLTDIQDPTIRTAARLWVPNRTSPRAVSPLHAPDLRGAAPAVVVTAGEDALGPEGDAYAERLRAAGVEVTHRREPGLPHGFVQGLDLEREDAAAATDRLIADVGRALGA
jgi:acetyl esterase